MEPPLASKFSKLICKYLDYNKLCSEGVTETDIDEPRSCKKAKYSHHDVKSEKIIGMLINGALKEYIAKNSNISYNKLLDHQIKELVILYQNKSPYHNEMQKVVSFVTFVISEESLSPPEVLASVFRQIDNLPFNFIWRLTKLQNNLLSLEKIINRIKNMTTALGNLINNLEQLMFKDIEDDLADDILKETFLTLVRLSYELITADYQTIQDACNKLLSGVLSKLLKKIESEDQSPKEFINIFDFVLQDNSLHDTTVQQFASNQLISVLTFEPKLRLRYAIQQQSKWRSTNFNKLLSSMVLSIVKMIGCEGSFITLDSVVSSLEVNWPNLLTFLGTLLLAYPDSSNKLKVVVDNYIRKGSAAQETEFLILGFLFARHASMEGRHVFLAYPQWFAATFGAETTSPANNKQSFIFLIKFLTNLVPYESAQVLKAQISQSIFVPKGCQSIFRDYQRIARCRLQDLNEDIGESSINKFGVNESKISEDVKSAVAQYNQSGKVPGSVLETAIFRRQYFISSFLSVLLIPRQLPSTLDARMKLIEELNSLGNIPEKMYKTYQEKCKDLKKEIPVPIIDNESESDSSEIKSLKRYLDKYMEISLSVNQDENKCMQLLSSIAECMEKLTAAVDEKLSREEDSSMIIIRIEEVNPDLVQYQVVTSVFNTLKSLLEIENCRFVHRSLGQLIVLLASTPSIQIAFIASIIKTFKSLRENTFSTKELKLFGVLLCEISIHRGLFLPVKLATSVDVNPSNVEDVLFDSLPLHDPELLFIVGCLLQSALEWNTGHVEEGENNPGKSPLLRRFYFLVASRLVVMNTAKMIRPENGDETVRNLTDYFPLIASRNVPICCQFLVKNFVMLVEEITFDDWIKYELESSWGDTPLGVKVKHLQHWGQYFLNEDKKNISDKKTENGFLILFWKLIDIGSCKKNSAELFILLQSLSLRNPISVTLMDEWKRWKRTVMNRSNLTEEKGQITYEYHEKLLIFLSMCHSLSPSIVCGRNACISTLNLFNELITDILVMEGSWILPMRDCLLLLECFLESVQKLSLPPSHFQKCFALLKESVLFHLKDMLPLLKKYSDVVEKYHYQHLMRLNASNLSSYQSLPDKEIAILLSFQFCGNSSYELDVNVPSQYNVIVFPYIGAYIGRDLSVRGWYWKSSEKVDSNDKYGKRFEQLMESASGFLDTVDTSTDVSALMSSWKELGSVPLFWKLFLLGFSHLLLVRLNKTIDNKTLIQYCFLLLCFNHLSSLFEDTTGCIDISSSYLSRINLKLHSLTKSITVTSLRMISETILRNCDKDLIALIRFRCSEN